MDLSLIDRQDFRTFTHDKTAEQFALIDYEVQLVFDGIRLTYRLIVPELGQWWNWDGEIGSQHDRHFGMHPYHAEATMENIAAAYDVSGYRTGKAHRGQPSSTLKANTTSVTSVHRDRVQVSPGQQAISQSPSAQLLSQRVTLADSPNSANSANRASGQLKTPKARPRQRPCGHCIRSKQALVCEISPKETSCTRCVRLNLTCKP